MSVDKLKEVTTGEKKSPLVVFSNFMEKIKPQLEMALPKHLTADRMARLALTAFSTNEKLQACDPKSIAASIMTASQLGLEPGVNGAGFLVPYKTTCTFVPGWKGLVDLVARSGRGTVYTGVIYKDQTYTFTDGARRDLVIHNETDLDDPLEITHAYAIGWVKDSSMPVIELWRVSKIKKHRDKYNKVGQSHYSFRDWEMYCRKVPLLQVLKYMPCSIEVSNAVEISNAHEMGRGVTIENGIVVDNGHGMTDFDKSTGEIFDEEKTTKTEKPKADEVKVSEDKPEIMPESMRSSEPSDDEKEKIKQQLIREAEADKKIDERPTSRRKFSDIE